MTKSYSNLRSLLFVCAVFLLSNFYSFSAFGQCNSATSDPSFNALDNELGKGYNKGYSRCILNLPNNKILLGGSLLEKYNNQDIKGIVRLNEDGTIDNTFSSLSPSEWASGDVRDIKVQDGIKILLAGDIKNSANQQKHIIRLNLDGSIDSSFEVTGLQSSSYVSVMSLQANGKILVAGELVVSGGNRSLIRLNSDGSIDNTFLEGTVVSIHTRKVQDMIIQPDGKIILVGIFNSYNTSNKKNIVRLNSDGSIDTSFNPSRTGFNGGDVSSVVLDNNGKIVLVGGFSRYNNVDNMSIVRLHQDGNVDNSFSSPIVGIPHSSGTTIPGFFDVAIQGNKIIALRTSAGSERRFTRFNYNGSIDPTFVNTANRYANYSSFVVLPNQKILTDYGIANLLLDRLNSNGSWDNTFNPSYGFNESVTESIVSNNNLYVFGKFRKYNNKIAYCVAKMDLDGTLDTTFNIDSRHVTIPTDVRTIAVQDDHKVLIGGSVGSIITQQKCLLRFDEHGLIDAGFNANGAGFSIGSKVNSIAIQGDGNILIGGSRFSSNGIRNFMRLNTDGSIDNSLVTTGVDGSVEDITLQEDGKLIITGFFSDYNGISASHIVRIMPNGDRDYSFSIDLNSVAGVEKVKLIDNGNILIALKKYDGSIELRKVDSFGNTYTNFNTVFPNILTGSIQDIALRSNGKLIVVGKFNQVNNVVSNNIVGLNSDGSIDTAFDIGVGTDKGINNIHIVNDNSIRITGEFTTYKTLARSKIAKITTQVPVVVNNTAPSNQYNVCDSTTLEVTGQGIVYWYNSITSTTSVQAGNSFTTPILTQDSTYFYVLDSIIGCGSSQRIEILVTTAQILNSVSKTNYTAYLDGTGNIEVDAILLDSASSSSCGNTIASYLFDDTGLATRSFSCTDTSTVHNVVLRVTDNNGNTETSPTIIHVKDTVSPVLAVRILPVFFNYSNQAIILARDFITSLSDNCTDSADISVIFNHTGLDSLRLYCGNSFTRNFNLRITDRAGNQIIQPVTINPSATSYDFNVNIISGTFRPNITSIITILANNYSCAPKSGELKVTLPATVTYNSASINPNRIVGNNLFWNVTDLNFDRNFVVRVSVTPEITLNIGNEVCFSGHITPETTDYYRANNLKQYCFPIVNSYDPNDKQVYPQGICTDKFTKRSDLPLTYTIRFQNTGNAPALNVKITDSLSTLLNRRSLRVVGTSHPMVVDTTANNNVINFRFNNINLPDSASNPALSQGYVIFELSEIAAHTDTSRINNKSYIYFDTNAPIITNTVKNTIVNVLPNCSPTNPNPPIAACTLPTNLRTEILSSNKVKLLWTNPAGTNAINYEILRNGQRLITVPASNLSFIDSTLIANTQYNYSIKAICGNSVATSNVVQVRTIPATPILLSVVAACKGEKGKINVQSAGATYRVYSSNTSTTPLFETNNASIETPVLSDSTTFYISVIINGLESQRLKAIVPIKEVFDAIVEQGVLFETCATEFNLSAKNVVGATYTWFRENVEVGTGRTLNTTFEARYKVRVIKNGCFSNSEFTTTRFVTAPTAKIKQGTSITFCGSGTLNAQDTSANVTYTWSLNGNTIKTGTYISVSQSGTYTLKASQPSCESSVTINVTITTAPTNIALTASKTAICTDTQTTLSVTTGTGFTYKWFKNNTAISNTSATLSTSEIGKYKVEVITADGCKVTTSEVEISRLDVKQATLRINTESGKDKTIDVTSQDAIDSVQWFKDGVLIPAFANKTLITPTETGNYKAIVTYSTGCKFEPTERVFTIGGVTGIEEESAKIFTIYPNPNMGSFKIEFVTTTNQKTKLTLVDGLGRIIHTQEIAMNQKTTSITLPKISAGVYVVQIISEGKVYTKQLVIQ